MRTEYPVTVCESGPHAALRIARPVRQDRFGIDIASGMRELEALVHDSGLTACGPTTTTNDEDRPRGDTDIVQFRVPLELAPRLGPRTGAEVIVVPGTMVARTVHRGSYHGLGAAYRALWEWAQESGFRPVGLPTQVYLVGPDEVVDPQQLITEIRLPVEAVRGLRVLVPGPYDRVVAAAEAALRRQGFRILARTDLDEALRHVADPGCRRGLLTVCHPRLADIGADTLLIPSLVVVRTGPDGSTEVAATDSASPIADFGDADLAKLAELTDGLLAAALAEISAEFRSGDGAQPATAAHQP